jgi:hypothetical protein
MTTRQKVNELNESLEHFQDSNRYTVHEVDSKTAQLVPTEVNARFNHDGGVSEHKNKKKVNALWARERRLVMSIINSIEHKELGVINCYSDNNGDPLMWGKKDQLKVFSEVEDEILVCFHLYCFNKDFKYKKYYEDKAERIEQNIVKIYKYMLENIKVTEDIFLDYINNYFFDEFDVNVKREEINIESVSDLYSIVRVVEIRVFGDSFSIIIEIPWVDEQIGISLSNIFDGESWSSVNYESESEVVEMDYN